MVRYLFDVDGTLTPACQKIDPYFKKWFNDWMKDKDIVLVTGSDKNKTINQIGFDLWSQLKVYQCSGNQYWDKGVLQYESPILTDYNLEDFLKLELTLSHYPVRAGNHIEKRNGMINFSIIGRNCTLKQRENYSSWDKLREERRFIRDRILSKFPNLDVHLGGQISIDIYNKGCTKAQVLLQLEDKDILFFGDKCKEGGNDYEIAKYLLYSQVHNVKSPNETWKILKELNGH